MKTRDSFGLIVRVIGLLALLSGLGATYAAFSALSFGRLLLKALFFGIPYLVVSIYLLRGAPQVVNFAYPEEEDAPPAPEPPEAP